ncbi:hypothetical protein [Streptomyces vilmorinianum]|uniref:hypothetical protein n=1 Tax=Streptomyces vilmorinianum TaxID=3051092 RepID=UPI0010FAF010|nr:hypothetical protein [Streptomyces vilmorinianum]
MSMSAWKRAGVSLAAVAVVAGVAGCQDGDGGGKAAEAPVKPKPQAQSQEAVTKVIQAAYTKTAEAKSAKVRMTVSVTGAGADSGTTEMSGVQGWDPAVMDVTMNGSMLGSAGESGMPDKIRVIMRDNVMYMDMGTEYGAQLDGRRWMKMDFAALAEQAGDKSLQKQMTQGLDGINQDPAQQLALLLESPNLKHVGPAKVEGVPTQHYKGTLSVEDMLNANKAYDELIPEKDRKTLLANIEKAGITGYDTELWVNEDGYPAKMVVGMKMPQGAMNMTAHYSDYGTQATVQAPPAKDTVDLIEMLKGLGES